MTQHGTCVCWCCDAVTIHATWQVDCARSRVEFHWCVLSALRLHTNLSNAHASFSPAVRICSNRILAVCHKKTKREFQLKISTHRTTLQLMPFMQLRFYKTTTWKCIRKYADHPHKQYSTSVEKSYRRFSRTMHRMWETATTVQYDNLLRAYSAPPLSLTTMWKEKITLPSAVSPFLVLASRLAPRSSNISSTGSCNRTPTCLM